MITNSRNKRFECKCRSSREILKLIHWSLRCNKHRSSKENPRNDYQWRTTSIYPPDSINLTDQCYFIALKDNVTMAYRVPMYSYKRLFERQESCTLFSFSILYSTFGFSSVSKLGPFFTRHLIHFFDRFSYTTRLHYKLSGPIPTQSVPSYWRLNAHKWNACAVRPYFSCDICLVPRRNECLERVLMFLILDSNRLHELVFDEFWVTEKKETNSTFLILLARHLLFKWKRDYNGFWTKKYT